MERQRMNQTLMQGDTFSNLRTLRVQQSPRGSEQVTAQRTVGRGSVPIDPFEVQSPMHSNTIGRQKKYSYVTNNSSKMFLKS